MQKNNDNFDWINGIAVHTKIAQKLVDYYHRIKPVWTEDLDAAARIVLFAANGGLTSRKANTVYLKSIEDLFSKKMLCNKDVVGIATDILEDSYFQRHSDSSVFFTENHCHIVQVSQKKLDDEMTKNVKDAR